MKPLTVQSIHPIVCQQEAQPPHEQDTVVEDGTPEQYLAYYRYTHEPIPHWQRTASRACRCLAQHCLLLLPSTSVSHTTWRSACGLVAIDMQSVQRFIIFSRIAEKQSDRVREGFSGKKVKDREGACRQHLVIRIPTDDIDLLLFQNANRQD